jgi:hypothetical protein
MTSDDVDCESPDNLFSQDSIDYCTGYQQGFAEQNNMMLGSLVSRKHLSSTPHNSLTSPSFLYKKKLSYFHACLKLCLINSTNQALLINCKYSGRSPTFFIISPTSKTCLGFSFIFVILISRIVNRWCKQ